MGSSRIRRLAWAAGIACALMGLGAPGAGAVDLWTETGQSLASANYWQGISFDPGARTFNFDGPAQGLWRTDANLGRLAGRSAGIPAAVKSTEGWNHVPSTDLAPRLMPLGPWHYECH